MIRVLSIFDNEEQAILNGLAESMGLNNISKDKLLEQMEFSIATREDDEVMLMYERLKEKILAFDEKDMEELKASMPFTPIYGEEAE